MSDLELRGVIAAVITPFDKAYRPDAGKAVPYYRELLANGCDGLNVLGTTGEGPSVSLDQRLEFMHAIASSGLPLERLIVGTGASAVGDAIRLTRAAYDLGFAAALVIPPFYYRDATDDGVVRFFDALIDAVRPPKRRLLLYNFPRMSGITFHVDVVQRLVAQFGEIIGGMKDSSNDVQLQSTLHERFAWFAIYPGSEEYLEFARTNGLTGCISGSVCLWPELAQSVWSDGDAQQAISLVQARQSLKGASLISAVRMHLAEQQHDQSWLIAAPPLT